MESLKIEPYTLEIKKPRNKRTLNQNALLWALVNEICIVEDGDLTNQEQVYLTLLEMSGAKSTIITIKKEAFEDMKKLVRHIKILNEVDKNGVGYYVAQVFFGSSEYDTKEMAALIDTTIKYASELGIETDYYKELLGV